MKGVPVLLAALVLLVLLSSSAFVVNEWEQVIIVRFGQPVRDPITEPGLKFKVPLIDSVRRFDRRFLEWSGDPEELPTRDKVFIWVDTYARWRITDPLRFLERLRDENRAQTRLDDFIDGQTRNAVANHNLIEVIRSTNRTPELDTSQLDSEGELAPIEVGRDGIRKEILAAVQEQVTDLGIEILDVQFRRINYGETVRPDVYNRMISERKRISDRFRSEGQGEASRILGEMDRELKRIQSEAYREAQKIVGVADAQATDIFAQAYNQSPDSRQFYQFLKTMETFRSTVDESTSLLLSTDGDFYQFLKGGSP
jgi:membrane protease subunit HflC